MGDLMLSEVNRWFYANANVSWGDLDGSGVKSYQYILKHMFMLMVLFGLGFKMFRMMVLSLSSQLNHKCCPAVPAENKSETSQIL